MGAPKQEKLLRSGEVIELTGLTKDELEAAVRNGLPHYRLGEKQRQRKYYLSDVQNYIRQRRDER